MKVFFPERVMEREEQFPNLSDHAIQEGNGLLNISNNFIGSLIQKFFKIG